LKRILEGHTNSVSSIASLSSPSFLASAGPEIIIWDLTQDKNPFTLRNSIVAIALLSNTEFLVTGGYDSKITT